MAAPLVVSIRIGVVMVERRLLKTSKPSMPGSMTSRMMIRKNCLSCQANPVFATQCGSDRKSSLFAIVADQCRECAVIVNQQKRVLLFLKRAVRRHLVSSCGVCNFHALTLCASCSQ